MREDRIPIDHGTDALRCASQDDVSRIQGVIGGRELNQSFNAHGHGGGVGSLAGLGVDAQGEEKVRRVGYLVGSHEPRSEHSEAVARFSKAPICGAADRHVQADAIARNVSQSIRLVDVSRHASDHHGELDFVVQSFRLRWNDDALRRADERRIRLQEQPQLLRRRLHVDQLGTMNARIDRGIAGVHLDMKTVVRRRGHDLPRIGHGAQQADIGEALLRRRSRDPLDPFLNLIEVRDHGIAGGQGPPHCRQDVERGRDVAHDVSLDQSKSVVVETAQAHCRSPRFSSRRDRGATSNKPCLRA